MGWGCRLKAEAGADAAVKEAIYLYLWRCIGGTGSREEPMGRGWVQCTPCSLLLDMTGDILCEGQNKLLSKSRQMLKK